MGEQATGIGRVFDVRSNDNGNAGFGIDNTGGDLQLRIDRMEAVRNVTGLEINGTGSAGGLRICIVRVGSFPAATSSNPESSLSDDQ